MAPHDDDDGHRVRVSVYIYPFFIDIIHRPVGSGHIESYLHNV